MDRSLLYEKWLDDLELYLTTKQSLNRKVRAAYAEGDYDTDVSYWQEYETLETLRELSRRALDEYVSTRPNPEGRDEAEEAGS